MFKDRLRVVRLIALTVAVALAGASCGHVAAGYQGDRRGHRVGVVGDSITVLSAPSIAADLKHGYQYRIVAKSGKTIDEMTPATVQLLHANDRPSRLIINLGTNDALQHNPQAVQQLRLLMTIVGHVSCVGWVTINPGFTHGRAAVADALNAVIRGAPRQHRQFHVIDWAAALGNPAAAGQWIQPDDIHPTVAGATALARMYRQLLDNDCG